MQCLQGTLSQLAGHMTFSLPVTASNMLCNHSQKFSSYGLLTQEGQPTPPQKHIPKYLSIELEGQVFATIQHF